MGFTLVCLLLPIYVFSKLHVGQVYSHVDVHRLVLLHCLWYMFSYRLLWLTVILLNYVRSSTSSTFSLLTNLNAINLFGFEKTCCCTSTLSDSSFFFSISRASLPVDCVKCSYVATTLSYSLSPLPFLRVKKGSQRHNRIQHRLEICDLSFLMQKTSYVRCLA